MTLLEKYPIDDDVKAYYKNKVFSLFEYFKNTLLLSHNTNFYNTTLRVLDGKTYEEIMSIEECTSINQYFSIEKPNDKLYYTGLYSNTCACNLNQCFIDKENYIPYIQKSIKILLTKDNIDKARVLFELMGYHKIYTTGCNVISSSLIENLLSWDYLNGRNRLLYWNTEERRVEIIDPSLTLNSSIEMSVEEVVNWLAPKGLREFIEYFKNNQKLSLLLKWNEELKKEIEELTIKCSYCGEIVKLIDCEWVADEDTYVCQDCVEERYTNCEHCGKLINNDDIVYSEEHGCLCQDCVDNCYFYCANCGKLCRNYDGLTGADGERYCQECFDEMFSYCDDCGCVFYQSDLNYNEEDEQYYCDDCNEDHKDNYVMEYHDFDDWKPLKLREPNESKYYLGFELETDNESAIKNLPDYYNVGDHSKVVFEHDGSIYGVECISQPFTIEWYRKYGFKDLTDALSNAGFDVCSDTGIHVHISKGAFTDLGILKLIWLFRKHWEDIEEFSGREMNGYARLNKSICNGYYSGSNAMRLSKLENKITYQKGERYQAINLEKEITVEIRIFQSSLKYERLTEIVEFCNNLVEIVKLPMNKLVKFTGDDVIKFDRMKWGVK